MHSQQKTTQLSPLLKLKTNTQDTDHSVLLKLLSKAKETFGKTQFKQASTALDEIVYQLAKEKNVALLSPLLNFTVQVPSTGTPDASGSEKYLFNLTQPINGCTPLYLIAKKACRQQEWDVIDFLLATYPQFVDKTALLLCFAEHNQIDRINDWLSQNPQDIFLRQEAMQAYYLVGNKQEAERLRVTSPAEIKLAHPGESFQLETLDIDFAVDVMRFCFKASQQEEEISLLALQTRFGYNTNPSEGEKLWIHMMLACYNHHAVLHKILVSLADATSDAEWLMERLALCLMLATMGGSYETICILLALNGNLRTIIAAALQDNNPLLACKLAALGRHASLLKTMPAKANLQLSSPSNKQEQLIRHTFIDVIKIIIDIIQNIPKIASADTKILPSHYDAEKYSNNLFNKYKISSIAKRENIYTFSAYLHSIVNLDSYSYQQAQQLEKILTAYLPLLVDTQSTHTLADLLNTPLATLLPSHGLATPHNLFQYLANNVHDKFIYLDFTLKIIPNIMLFILPNTLTEHTIFDIGLEKKRTFSILLLLAASRKNGLFTLMEYPAMLNIVEQHDLFREHFISQDNDETKIEKAPSVAHSFLQESEETAAFFLKNFGDALAHHIDNPLLFFSLLKKNVGIKWLQDNIHLLKNVSHTTFNFANNGQCFVANDEFVHLIIKDEKLINTFPDKHREQFIKKQAVIRDQLEKIRRENQKIVAGRAVVDKKADTKDALLIKEMSKHGYQVNIDFSVTQKGDAYELLFMSKKGALSYINDAFKDECKKNKQMKLEFTTSKGNIHKLSLSFPQQKIDHMISIITSKRALKKQTTYQGCIHENTVSQPATVNKTLTVDQAKWEQAIHRIFCESEHIQIAVTNSKKLTFTVTCSHSGTEWKLKKNPHDDGVMLMVTDNNIKQFFITSLIENLQNTKLASVEWKKLSGNQYKIIITPHAKEPGDAATIQSNNFDALELDNKNRLPRIYGTAAVKKVEVSAEERSFFLHFQDVCLATQPPIEPKLMRRDSGVPSYYTGAIDSSKDSDYATTCQDPLVFKQLGLTKNTKKNIENATLYSGFVDGKWRDVVVVPDDQHHWANSVATATDITSCSVGLVMEQNAFYLLDPTGRGIADYEQNKIVATAAAHELDDLLEKDPIRIIRAIKFQIRDNEIDPAYKEAILRWKARSCDIKEFSIKLLSEMKNANTHRVDINDPVVLNWIQYLKEYGIMEKVYQQNKDISNAAALATIGGQYPEPFRLFVPAPPKAESMIDAVTIHNKAFTSTS